MKSASIACYYPWVYLRSGVERTILETVRRSRHRWTIYTNHFDLDGTFPEFRDLDVVELPRISVDRGFLNVAKGALRLLAQKLPLEKHDVLFVHSEGLGDFVTFRNGNKPIVCYCHQPLLVANDPTVQQRYSSRNPHKASLLALFGSVFRTVDRLAWKRYEHVFVSSRTIQEAVGQAGLVAPEETEILAPGVDCESIHPSDTLGNYFLAFARLKWWKNIELSINAFRHALRNGGATSNFRLVVAGQVDAGSGAYLQELRRLAEGCPQISFIINPTGEQVRQLYDSCFAVMNTTLREPWGIIPLEANAYGKAVIAVNQGGTLDSQEHGVTGLLAPPTPEHFAEAIETLASDPALARKMGVGGRKNAERYDWALYVERLDSFLDQYASAQQQYVRGAVTLSSHMGAQDAPDKIEAYLSKRFEGIKVVGK
jgi:glycosyltransferase involved in cell wall biosynthesis